MNSNRRQLEICCTTLACAMAAQRGGADRIELCERLDLGGITPSRELLLAVKAQLQIPVFVLVRPRGGDFHYTDSEWNLLLEQIAEAHEDGADGIVSGALREDGFVDLERTAQLLEVTHPLPFTFHRAFDRCREPLAGIQQLADLGVQRILTSGQQDTALQGMENLRAYAEIAADRMSILVGGGVRIHNLPELLKIASFREFHSAAGVQGRVDEAMVSAMKRSILQ